MSHGKETGIFARGYGFTKVHAVVDRKPLCGYNFPISDFVWLGDGHDARYIDCKHCKTIISESETGEKQ